MKKYKILTWIFGILAILLSDIMCAVVASSYTQLLWCGMYGGCSAPAEVAFLYAIPFLGGIIICCVLSWYFHRKT